MEFKYRAVDNVTLTATSHSPSPVTYLPHQSLESNCGFSGFRPPLTGEEALRRVLEKEVIRREILRRMELEEEVRRELAFERELGISIPKPLMNIHGLVSQWSNSSVMNSVAVSHTGSSQPQSILPPTETIPSPENSDKDKVIVLARPDPDLFNAKRKTMTSVVFETEPSAFGLKKKLKEKWSCALCEIKATSESGLNAHLNGKKHKNKEARQNKMICKSSKKCEKIVNIAKAIEIVDTKMMVDKSINESKNEKELIKTSEENDVTLGKKEEKLAVMIYKDVNHCENGELHVENSKCFSESNIATEEARNLSD